MNKRVGILGILCAAAVSLLHPATASAQDRDDYRRGGYVQSYRDNDRNYRRDDRYARDYRFREAREWQIRREQERCERERWERRHDRAYDYRYSEPVVRFGFRWDGR